MRDLPEFSRRRLLKLALAASAGAALPLGPALGADAAIRARPIPRTGEMLPVVGLGTAIVFDFDSASDAPKRSERRDVIRTLVDGGGHLIDTAPSYGRAESTVGDLLSEPGVRERIFLATKVRAISREACIAQMQESLKRLRTNRIELMQLHNVGSMYRGDASAQLALLREWKERGVIRYIGVTHSQDMEAASDLLIDLARREKLDFMQINYSMAERSAEQALLSAAAETGTAVLVNLPFARGKLFSLVRGKALPPWTAEFDAGSWGQFFLKYILANEAVTAVIPGTDKPDYMADNLNAGRGRLPDATMRKRMLEFLKLAVSP